MERRFEISTNKLPNRRRRGLELPPGMNVGARARASRSTRASLMVLLGCVRPARGGD